MSEGIHGTMIDGTEPSPSGGDSGWSTAELRTQVATVGVIVVGAALIEVGLIPGMIVGLAAAVAPRYVPRVASAVRPMVISAIRGVNRFRRGRADTAVDTTDYVDLTSSVPHSETDLPVATASTVEPHVPHGSDHPTPSVHGTSDQAHPEESAAHEPPASTESTSHP